MIRVPGEWRLTLLLLAGCVLLGGLLAVQLRDRSAAGDAAGGGDGAPGPDVETPAPGLPARYSPPALASFDEILARPLFVPDRRPVEVPEPAAAPGPPPTPLRARLEGVARTGETSVAVVRDLSTNEGLRLSKGMEYQGWTVERVEPERAVLTRGDGQVTELKLERQRQ